MSHNSFVYIITNKYNKVLYTGVTSNLKIRIWEPQTKAYPDSFTAKYNCNKLVWYEQYGNIKWAIDREKQIKAGSRMDKVRLIEAMNPQWKDLWEVVREW